MSWLDKKILSFDSKVAILHKGTSYTYKQLQINIKNIKEDVIKGNIDRSEVVSILSDYSFDSICLLLALYENKNVIVPITANIDK